MVIFFVIPANAGIQVEIVKKRHSEVPLLRSYFDPRSHRAAYGRQTRSFNLQK